MFRFTALVAAFCCHQPAFRCIPLCDGWRLRLGEGIGDDAITEELGADPHVTVISPMGRFFSNEAVFARLVCLWIVYRSQIVLDAYPSSFEPTLVNLDPTSKPKVGVGASTAANPGEANASSWSPV